MTDFATLFDRALALQTAEVARNVAESYERRRLLGDQLSEQYGLIGDQGLRLAAGIYNAVEELIKSQAAAAGKPIDDIPDKLLSDVVDALRPQWSPMVSDAKRMSEAARR